jgi:RNA recognition motif-containing protein
MTSLIFGVEEGLCFSLRQLSFCHIVSCLAPYSISWLFFQKNMFCPKMLPIPSIGPQLPGAPAPNDMSRQQALYGAAAAAKEKEKVEKNVRTAGGKVWTDESLADWNESDYRIFVGDLGWRTFNFFFFFFFFFFFQFFYQKIGNEVGDEMLHKAFAHYGSLDKVKVVRDKITGKSKGYGFVSLLDPIEFLKCLKEMNGSYIGNRPCKLKKSNWKQRNLEERFKKGKSDAIKLIKTQSKGTGTKVKKRKARPENANRDELRKKPATGLAPRWG